MRSKIASPREGLKLPTKIWRCHAVFSRRRDDVRIITSTGRWNEVPDVALIQRCAVKSWEGYSLLITQEQNNSVNDINNKFVSKRKVL